MSEEDVGKSFEGRATLERLQEAVSEVSPALAAQRHLWRAVFTRVAEIAEACTKTGYGVGGERLRYIDADEFVRLLREEAGK